MNKKKFLSVFLSTIMTGSMMLGTTVFAADSNSTPIKAIVNSSIIASPNVMMTKSKTVYKTYSSLSKIPESIYYTEYDSVWWSGTLILDTAVNTGSSYSCKYVGTLHAST